MIAPSENRPPPLGWPWDQLADAALRVDAADRAILVAGTAGDVMARSAAELARDEAAGDFRRVREELALQWLAGFRAALEFYPAAVAEVLGRMPPCERVTEALGELEDRVDEAEDFIVGILKRRVSA